MSDETSNDEQDRTPPKAAADWESTLQPPAAAPGTEGDEFELDLEVDDIQTRLPYGSEDIADK